MRRRVLPALLIPAFALSVALLPRSAAQPPSAHIAATCGEERWPVKTLSDPAGEAGQLQAARQLDRPASEEAPSARRAKHQADRGSGDDQLPGGGPPGRDEARGRPRHPPGDRGTERAGQDDDRGVPRHDLQRRIELTEEGEDGERPLRDHRGLRSALLQPLHEPRWQGEHHGGRVLRYPARPDRRCAERDRAASSSEVLGVELLALTIELISRTVQVIKRRVRGRTPFQRDAQWGTMRDGPPKASPNSDLFGCPVREPSCPPCQASRQPQTANP